jgi:hypothetical protein
VGVYLLKVFESKFLTFYSVYSVFTIFTRFLYMCIWHDYQTKISPLGQIIPQKANSKEWKLAQKSRSVVKPRVILLGSFWIYSDIITETDSVNSRESWLISWRNADILSLASLSRQRSEDYTGMQRGQARFFTYYRFLALRRHCSVGF